MVEAVSRNLPLKIKKVKMAQDFKRGARLGIYRARRPPPNTHELGPDRNSVTPALVYGHIVDDMKARVDSEFGWACTARCMAKLNMKTLLAKGGSPKKETIPHLGRVLSNEPWEGILGAGTSILCRGLSSCLSSRHDWHQRGPSVQSLQRKRGIGDTQPAQEVYQAPRPSTNMQLSRNSWRTPFQA